MESYTGFEMFRTDKYGKLRIDEIYGYYDGPLIFSCRDTSERLYFSYCIKIEVPYSTWMIFPVSPAQLKSLTDGEITLRAFLYKRRFDAGQLKDTSRKEVSVVRPIENILPFLPVEGVYL